MLYKILFSSKAPLFLLIAILILWLFVPPFFKASFHEFQAPAWVAANYLDDLESSLSTRKYSKSDLIKANKALARENAAYELHYSESQLLWEEVNRLKEFLALPSLPSHRYEIANVIRREINAWWQQITIDKGLNYDIPEGAPVVFAGGVVGRVAEVRAYTANIELISSPNFRMVARFEDDNRPVTYQGAGARSFAPPKGLVSTVQRDVTIAKGKSRQLISTGWGGVFPAGLAIGKVKQLKPGSDDLFQSGQVDLDRRLLSLYEVAILVPVRGSDLLRPASDEEKREPNLK